MNKYKALAAVFCLILLAWIFSPRDAGDTDWGNGEICECRGIGPVNTMIGASDAADYICFGFPHSCREKTSTPQRTFADHCRGVAEALNRTYCSNSTKNSDPEWSEMAEECVKKGFIENQSCPVKVSPQ